MDALLEKLAISLFTAAMLGKLVVSLFTATIGAFLGAQILKNFYKPRVIVRYQDINPLHDSTGTYWSIKIENYGRTVAKDCVAVVTLYGVNQEDILPKEDVCLEERLPEYKHENTDLAFPREQILSDKHFRPIIREPICWSKLGNPDVIDINPGISQSFDLCKYRRRESGEGYFIFPSEEGWRRVRVRLKEKKYEGHVLVCPSNEYPAMVCFSLDIKNGNPTFIAKKKKYFQRFRRNKYD